MTSTKKKNELSSSKSASNSKLIKSKKFVSKLEEKLSEATALGDVKKMAALKKMLNFAKSKI